MKKEKSPKKGGAKKIIGIVVAVIIVLAIIGSIGGNDGSQQADNSQTTEAVSQAPVTEADQGADTQEATPLQQLRRAQLPLEKVTLWTLRCLILISWHFLKRD